MTQITRVLNDEVEKTEDLGETEENIENILEILYGPEDIFPY
jgi:hypothetical protein